MRKGPTMHSFRTFFVQLWFDVGALAAGLNSALQALSGLRPGLRRMASLYFVIPALTMSALPPFIGATGKASEFCRELW